MRLDLTEIALNLGKHFHYEVNEECEENEDFRCVEPVKGGIDFTNAGRLIIVRGKLATVVELECGRCLDEFITPVKMTVEEQFPIVDPHAVTPEHTEEIEEDEVDESLFLDNVFDLSEYIRQAVLVEVPIRPLCREDCKGLCPTCGMDLNEGACGCPVETEDSPFAALKVILEKSEGEEGA